MIAPRSALVIDDIGDLLVREFVSERRHLRHVLMAVDRLATEAAQHRGDVFGRVSGINDRIARNWRKYARHALALGTVTDGAAIGEQL